MNSLILVHPEDRVTIPIHQAINKCSLFSNNPALTISPYRVQSPVSLSIIREFVAALEGKTVNITPTNLLGLEQLCSEFGFSEFSSKLSKLSQSFQFSEASQGRQIGSQLSQVGRAFLRESFEFIVNGSEFEREVCESAALFGIVREQLSVDSCARKFHVNLSGIDPAVIDSLEVLLSGETISNVSSQFLLSNFVLNDHLERFFLNFSRSDVGKNLSELMIERVIEFRDISNFSVDALDNLLLNESISVESEDSLLRDILKLGPDYRDLVRHIHIVNLTEDGLSLLSESFDVPSESVFRCTVERITRPPPPPLDSQIISDFPEIFAEFRRKRFSLLWRGSRDGFKAQDFHIRCDGHGNTLTMILDTKGNIFGGFTPVKWESRVWNRKTGNDDNCFKPDDSLKSFVFTLKNPHNISARRFGLKSEMKHQAILCDSDRGPIFGYYPSNIYVCDNCSTNTFSSTFLGRTYTNDTGLNNDIVFTGSSNFRVKEIEVFRITE
jgi:hypothetical protein